MLNRQQLLDNIRKAFDEEELRTLCYYLKIDYDELRGMGKEGKSRELVLYCERHGMTSDLIDQCFELRPYINWRTCEPKRAFQEKEIQHEMSGLETKNEYVQDIQWAVPVVETIAAGSTLAVLYSLLERLDDVQIDTFCLNYFPEVYDRFSRGLRRDEKINLLLEHCRRTPGAATHLSHCLLPSED